MTLDRTLTEVRKKAIPKKYILNISSESIKILERLVKNCVWWISGVVDDIDSCET